MPELWSVHATEEACDIAMRAPAAGRVAADEVFVAGSLASDLRAAVRKLDPHALIREASEGWDEVVLALDEADDVWPRLSSVALPSSPGYVQGDVARVAVRAFVRPDRVMLYVRAPWAHHVRRRIDALRGGG